jgi:iron complex outermembrane receptor protein
MNLKNIGLTLLTLLAAVSVFAQTGAIKGTVKTSDGKPARSVTISLKEINKATTVDEDGRFTLNHIKPGSYTLVASYVGFTPQTRQIAVKNHETITLDLVLSESSQQLSEVVVSGNKANKFSTPKSDDLGKMPLKDLENPQVYTTVNSALIQEQQLTNFNDIMRNVPGLSVLFANQAFGSATFTTRGFATSANLRNGVSSLSNSDIDPANIEKIEVLKGPSATLFGSSLVSWGGLINRVTKQPYDHFGGEVSYTGGSYGLNRFTADVNSPLSKDTTVLFRLNVAHTYNGSFQDAGFTKSTFVAPVITYKPNDRLTISLEAEFYNREGTTPFSVYVFSPMAVHSVTDLNLNYKRSFTNDGIVVASLTTNFFGTVNYKLSDHWTSQTLISTTNSPQKGPYLWNNFTSAKGDSIQRTITDWNSVTTTTDIQQNFISDYKWGNIRNRLVAGLDYFNEQSKGTYYYLPFDVVSLGNPGAEYLNLTQSAITAKEATGQYGPNYNESNTYTYAAYVSEVFNLTDNLIFNAALRIDHFDNKGSYDPVALATTGNYQQTALSPKFGIVYQPVKDQVSIFANYLNGFTNNTGTDFSGKPFKASNGNQLEGGVKLNLLDNKLSATVSYYVISASDLLETDAAHTNFSIQDGAEKSKGIEASVTASPFTGFDLVAGYSHNNALYTRDYQPFLGLLRDEQAGPANTANLYASYHITSGELKGLGLGFGANYYSSDNIGLILPAYTLLNASVFYDQPRFRIGLKMDNLTNKEYWTGWNDLSPQLPRNVSANVIIKF